MAIARRLSLLVISVFFLADEAAFAADESVEEKIKKVPAPFTSDEEFEYLDAKAVKLFSFMKERGYKGIVTRPFARHEILRKMDLYMLHLKQATAAGELCPLVLDRLFGIKKEAQGDKAKDDYRGIALASEDLGRKGLFCQAVIEDRSPGSLSPRRRLLVRRSGNSVLVFVIKLENHQKDVSFDDAAEFTKTLKIKGD